MAKQRPAEEVLSGAFWLTIAGVAAWIGAAFYIILN